MGLALGRLLGDVAPGAGVVEPVGQLDDEDPDVAGHRDDHLADRLGLRGLAVGQPVQLGHAVDEARDLLTEVAAQLGHRVGGVLDRVVQQRGGQRGRRHAELGEDRRHGERVRDVGVAGLAQLAPVGLLGDDVGLLDDRDVGLGVRRADGLEDRLEDRVAGAGSTEASEARAHASRRRQGRRRGCARRHVGADLLAHDESVVGTAVPPRCAPSSRPTSRVRAARWRTAGGRRPSRDRRGRSARGRRRCR